MRCARRRRLELGDDAEIILRAMRGGEASP